MSLCNRFMLPCLLVLLGSESLPGPVLAGSSQPKNSQTAHVRGNFLVTPADSCKPQPSSAFWPDSLCDPDVLRRLMGDLPIEVGNVQRPELYWMLQKWSQYPYRYAGRNSSGIDCSGMVCEIQHTVYGRSYRGGSADIYRRLQPIPRIALQEGDMVFFKIRRNRISHVGLYLGSNKFLHATTRAGVIISDLDEPYYRKRYFGAGRDPDPPQLNPVYTPESNARSKYLNP